MPDFGPIDSRSFRARRAATTLAAAIVAAVASAPALPAQVELQKLHDSHDSTRNKFGNSVALSGDALLVGGTGESSARNESGRAYVYRNTTGSWVEEAVLVRSRVARLPAGG